jgi:ABC-type bacteriocin/lantibiotic exporter with double-glycine peptidase domain
MRDCSILKQSLMRGRVFLGPHTIRRQFSLFPMILVIISLISCATGREISGSGEKHIITGVPFYAQEAYQCGPASLAGVLNFWGVEADPGMISKEIFSRSARGTLNLDMVLYAQKRGLYALQYAGNMDDLRKNIDSGHPLIVLVAYGFSLYEVDHFMVVTGYYDNGVIVNSGREQKKFMDEGDFLKIWAKANYWTLLLNKDR